MSDLQCRLCGKEASTGPVYSTRCSCGGLWVARDPDMYPAARGRTETPLWPDPVEAGLCWKREDLNSSGSFKDRGAAVLAEVAVGAGARALVVDSSGSAALAAASAAARAGLPVTVHVPAGIPQEKLHALQVLGARVVAQGTRSDAAERAQAEAMRSFYFSHVFHPAFFEGTAQAALEVLAAGESWPLWIVPTGNGSLLLGLAHALVRQNVRDVRLIAVQAAACPGLRAPGSTSSTRATGIGIADPPRREEILAALRAQGGEVVLVSEDEIEEARTQLGLRGIAAERAAAAALAAIRRLRAAGEPEPMLGFLTGSALRAP